MGNMKKVNRLIRTIGKTNFVEYFSDYKELALQKDKFNMSDKMPLAKKLLENNPKATKLSGQMMRINAAIIIFQNGWENDALKEVVNSTHPSVSEEIKNNALVLINN